MKHPTIGTEVRDGPSPEREEHSIAIPTGGGTSTPHAPSGSYIRGGGALIVADGMSRADALVMRRLSDGTLRVDLDTGAVLSNLGKGAYVKASHSPVRLKRNNCGYLWVDISHGGHRASCYAHRVIWLAANGPIPAGMEVDHINGDPGDNRLSNLRLLPWRENRRSRHRKPPARRRQPEQTEGLV